MSAILVVEIGHFLIGLLYGLMMLSHEYLESSIQKYISNDENSEDKRRTAMIIREHKHLILITCVILGYLILLYDIQRICRKLIKRGSH